MEEIMGSINSLGNQIVDHNRKIIDQIDRQLRSGFGAALIGNDYYVIRSETTGILSVLSSSTVSDEKNIVFGPGQFQQCIKYVNSAMVTRLAENNVDAEQKQGADK